MAKELLQNKLHDTCRRMFGCSLTEATEKQVYRALCTFVRESLEEQNRAFQKRLSQNGEKKVYYMSMEFLVGTSLRNNLYNLGILDEVKTLLEKQGFYYRLYTSQYAV